MAISYPLTLPDTRIVTIRPVARDAVGYSRSPFTFEGQAFDWGGQTWEADVELPAMTRAQAEPWVAFLLALRGRLGTFLMGFHDGAAPRGAGGGTPVVDGGPQTGAELAIRGAPAGQAGWLLTGDIIQLGVGTNARLHKVLADVDTDGAGEAVIDIWPGMRIPRVDTQAVRLTGTLGAWRLATNERDWSVNAARHYGLRFTAMEAT